MVTAEAAERRTCPKCGDAGDTRIVAERGYHCLGCGFELAHLDLAPNGTVRGVIGWLRAPGTVLQERYRVAGVLARGGFAATYLVDDLRLKGKRRAVKEIPALFYDEHETSLLGRLHHPAIPDIVDRFEADGMVYLVLEFGGDRTLEKERRTSGGTIPLPVLLPWMGQLCDVLAYLHGRTPPIVHRDLKPENILLDERDRVMLIDFGIAKESEEMAVTRTIARSASHGYSPPEQVLGTGTDERSDVYALGATVYAVLTGSPPPPAHERVAGRELPMPRTLNPAIPPALEASIVQALDLNINSRQQSIHELRLAFAPSSLEVDAGATTRPTERIAAPGAGGRAELGRGSIGGTGPAATTARASRSVAVSGGSGWVRWAALSLIAVAAGFGWMVLGSGSREAEEALVEPAVDEGATPRGGQPPGLRPLLATTPSPGAATEGPSAMAPGRRPQPDMGSVDSAGAAEQLAATEPDTASRALEEALRRRRAAEGHAPPGRAEPTPTAEGGESLAERVRVVLHSRGMPHVTVKSLGSDRIRIANLRTEVEATRAKDIVAVMDATIAVETSLQEGVGEPRRAQVSERRPSTPPPPEERPAPGGFNWRRKGATRTD